MTLHNTGRPSRCFANAADVIEPRHAPLDFLDKDSELDLLACP